ncbi:unnamed protein product, partial [Ectocarpus sp. 12 AP-2014]
MPDTLGYYDNNAAAFVEATFEVRMNELYEEFLPMVPGGGHILDAGCGSGRDALYFSQSGYRVTAFDGSESIAMLASKKSGLSVQHRTFSDVSELSVYDGIWACASLLHLPESDVPDAIERLWLALKPGRALYMSFKVGSGERQSNGRHFTDANEDLAERWIHHLSQVESFRLWRTTDQRPGRDEQWLNILVCKQHAPHKQLTIGGKSHHFLPKLCHGIRSADQVHMAVAFVKTTGLNLLFPDLISALQRDSSPVTIKILTSDYLDITDPEALRKLV